MEEFFIKALQLLSSLSILVFLHELGHFIPARLFKTRVEKFYLFFNPWFALYKRKIGETEWGIGWLPLGGYVKIAGMIDESMDKEQMAKPAQPWEFRSKKPWQRLIIMTGGVIVNIIVSFVLYIMVLGVWGEDQIHTKDLEYGLAVHPAMEKYGLVSGDNVLEINGEPVLKIEDIAAGIMFRDQYNLKIQHANGSIEQLKLSEDIEYLIFENGWFPIFGLRRRPGSVEALTCTAPFSWVYQDASYTFKSGTVLLEINDTPISEIASVRDMIREEKPMSLTLAGEDTVKRTVGTKDLQKCFARFPALLGGLRPKDSILSINDRNIAFFDDIQSELYKNKETYVDMQILRGKDTMDLSVRSGKMGTIGFGVSDEVFLDSDKIQHIDYSFGQSFGAGMAMGMQTLSDYIGQLKFVFTQKGASSLGGFGTIGKMFSPTWNWRQFWTATAFISIILAFMNILPIPALDGGHVVFLLYEMVTGREAPQRVLEVAQMIGFFLLMGLILYANGNDIFNALFD